MHWRSLELADRLGPRRRHIVLVDMILSASCTSRVYFLADFQVLELVCPSGVFLRGVALGGARLCQILAHHLVLAVWVHALGIILHV